LSAALESTDTQMDIETIGYELTGGFAKGRDRVILRDDTGSNFVVEIDGVGASPGSGQERLTLAAAAGADAAQGRSGSFLDLVRLDQDVVELTHYADTAGATEVSAAFRSFNRDRVPATPLIDPLPTATMSDEGCGTPASQPSECAPVTFPAGIDIWFRVDIDPARVYSGVRLRGAFIGMDPPPGSLPGARQRTRQTSLQPGGVGEGFYFAINHELLPFEPGDFTTPNAGWRLDIQYAGGSFVPGGGAARVFYMRPGFTEWALLAPDNLVSSNGWFLVPNHNTVHPHFVVP